LKKTNNGDLAKCFRHQAVDDEDIYTPIYQRKSSGTNPAREMLKNSTRNARVGRARARRHLILFGDGETPGLADSITRQPDASLGAPNVFIRSEAQQQRILRARAIRHRLLFGDPIEISLPILEGMELAMVATTIDPDFVEVAGVPEAADDVPEVEAGNFSSFITESYDDLQTPPSSPVKKACVVQSDSYGGSINYSHRLSRNTQEFEDIIPQLFKNL
jgi:hypothetical protein